MVILFLGHNNNMGGDASLFSALWDCLTKGAKALERKMNSRGTWHDLLKYVNVGVLFEAAYDERRANAKK